MKTIADGIERALDDALRMTFPASDPVAVFVPAGPAEARIETRQPLAPGVPRRGQAPPARAACRRIDHNPTRS
jgi:hypothetical protein